jgi:hypothetical protein
MKRTARAVVIALLLGCASDEQTDAPNDAPRGPRQLPSETVAAQPQPTAEAPRALEAPAAARKDEPEEPQPEKKDERDYAAELLAAIGTPAHCVKPRTGPDVPSEIRIDVDVTVVEIGRVTRAYVSSPGLEPDELKCVEQQVAALRLAAPIDAAPRSVRTTVVLKLQPAAAPDAQRADGEGTTARPADPSATQLVPAQPAAGPEGRRESPEESGP